MFICWLTDVHQPSRLQRESNPSFTSLRLPVSGSYFTLRRLHPVSHHQAAPVSICSGTGYTSAAYVSEPMPPVAYHPDLLTCSPLVSSAALAAPSVLPNKMPSQFTPRSSAQRFPSRALRLDRSRSRLLSLPLTMYVSSSPHEDHGRRDTDANCHSSRSRGLAHRGRNTAPGPPYPSTPTPRSLMSLIAQYFPVTHLGRKGYSRSFLSTLLGILLTRCIPRPDSNSCRCRCGPPPEALSTAKALSHHRVNK